MLGDGYDDESYRGMLPKLRNLLAKGAIPPASPGVAAGCAPLVPTRGEEGRQREKEEEEEEEERGERKGRPRIELKQLPCLGANQPLHWA